MKTAARDSCEVVVNTGRAASLARPVATSPACRSRRPTWLASGSNSPPVGDLGQCRQSHWRAGDARGSGNRPQARLEAATSEIRQAEDITPAFDTLKSRAEALYVVRSPLLTTNWIRISSLAAAARLPTMSGFWEYVEAGGLMSYGANFPVPLRAARPPLSTRFCAAPRPDFANGKSRSRTPGSLTVPISRDQIGPIGQSSPPDRGSSRCGDPLVMIRVSVRQSCSIRATPNGGLLPVVDAAIWRQSAERLQIHIGSGTSALRQERT